MSSHLFLRAGRGHLLSLILMAALLSDLFQAQGVLLSHDVRLWQGFILAAGAMLAMAGRLVFPKIAVSIIALITLHSMVIVLIIGGAPYFMLVQIALILALIVVMYSALRQGVGERVVWIYMTCGIIVAWSVIVEQLLNIAVPSFAGKTIYALLKKWPGPGGLVRAHGIMMEPSQVALIVPPALFLALMSGRRWVAILLGVSGALTLSGLTYIGMLIASAIYVVTRRKGQVATLSVAAVLAALAIFLVEPIRDRVEATLKVPAVMDFSGAIDPRLVHQELGGSVGSVALAARVSWQGFQANSLMGLGIGNMRMAGEQFLRTLSPGDVRGLSESTSLLVKVDTGGSLILRIMAEFGVFGLIGVLYGIFRTGTALRRIRALCSRSPSWIADTRTQIIGMAIVVIWTYMIRKDGYVNIYLLFPLMSWAWASSGLRSAAKPVMERDVARLVERLRGGGRLING